MGVFESYKIQFAPNSAAFFIYFVLTSIIFLQAFEQLDPFIPVETKTYDDKEFNSCVDYYLDRRWIVNPYGGSEEGRKELAFLSNNNPYELMRVCAPL